MTENIQDHLKAIQAWLDRVDQTPLPAPAAKGLTQEEKHQLQAVNKAIEPLAKAGLQIPNELRALKLRLSANDVAVVSNPQVTKHLAGVEILIDGLRELSQAARALRDKLKSGVTVSGTKKHFGVTLAELLDAGFLSTDDRLELRWSQQSSVYAGKVLSDGTVSAKTDHGWKTFKSLSTAATEISGRSQNGWDHWRRINADGTNPTLNEIRAEYLKQANDS